MLYVFHGTDSILGRDKLSAFIDTLKRKNPDTNLERVRGGELSEARFQELLETRSLFSGLIIVLLDQPFELKEGKALVLDRMEEMAASENIFIVFEGTLDEKSLKKFSRCAEKVVAYGHETVRSEQPFNRFAITDALLRRDRKMLWVLFERARREAVSDEEIHGMLFWQLKNMLLAKDEKHAEGTGLKPFVFTKAKNGALKFKESELQKLTSDLVTLYHEARRGRYDLGNALERWVLEV